MKITHSILFYTYPRTTLDLLQAITNYTFHLFCTYPHTTLNLLQAITNYSINLLIIGCALHMAFNGINLEKMNPFFSLISISSSPTRFHSKHWINNPKVKLIARIAKASPGQALLPNPNAINLSSSPSFSSLSGLKLVASLQMWGSLLIDQALINTVAFRGTLYPPIVQSSEDEYGNNKGAGVYNRRVSRMIFLRHGSFGRSNSSSKRSWPTWVSNLFLTFFNAPAWLVKQDIVHSRVTADESVPARSIFYNVTQLDQMKPKVFDLIILVENYVLE